MTSGVFSLLIADIQVTVSSSLSLGLWSVFSPPNYLLPAYLLSASK